MNEEDQKIREMFLRKRNEILKRTPSFQKIVSHDPDKATHDSKQMVWKPLTASLAISLSLLGVFFATQQARREKSGQETQEQAAQKNVAFVAFKELKWESPTDFLLESPSELASMLNKIPSTQ